LKSGVILAGNALVAGINSKSRQK